MKPGDVFRMDNGVYCRYYEIIAIAPLYAYMKRIPSKQIKTIIWDDSVKRMLNVTFHEAYKAENMCFLSIHTAPEFFITYQYKKINGKFIYEKIHPWPTKKSKIPEVSILTENEKEIFYSRKRPQTGNNNSA